MNIKVFTKELLKFNVKCNPTTGYKFYYVPKV